VCWREIVQAVSPCLARYATGKACFLTVISLVTPLGHASFRLR